MSKYLKNTTESDIVAEGYTFTSSNYQLIDPLHWDKIGQSSVVLGYVSSGDLVAAEDNTGNTDITDLNTAINFLKNLLPPDVHVTEAKWYKDAVGSRARWKGFTGTATAGQTTDIDFQIPEERYISGMAVILTNCQTGDYASFQIVDKDGVYYEAGTVLDTFVENWYFSGESERQCDSVSDYPAKIYAGLYIRIKYTSTGQSNVAVMCNVKLHLTPEV